MTNFKLLAVMMILSVGLANAQTPSSLTVQFTNGVITANQQSGATAATQLANAISTACSSGVKAVDARNFGPGNQSVTSTITLGCASNVSLQIIFDPTTVWTPSGTGVNMFSILPGAEVDDLSIKVTGMSGYAGNVISLSGSSLYFNVTPRTYIHNLQVVGQVLSGCCTVTSSNVTGTAISLTAVSSGTFVGWVDFDKVSISGMLYGVYASATNGSWINANAFKDLRVTGAVHGVYLTTDSTSSVESNDFDRYENEYAATYSTDAINISGTNCSANKFPSTSIWDYPGGNTSVSIGANCHGNYIYGLIGGTISDSNTYNPIMDYNGSRFYDAPYYTTGLLGAPNVNASAQATAYRINNTTVMSGDGTSLYLQPQVATGNVYVGGGGSAFYIDQYGMLHTNGTSPTASTGSVTGTNTGGYVSSLTAANSVTITFANSGYSTWASCVGNTSTNSTVYGTGSKTSWTFTFSAAVTGALSYHCDGR